MTIASGTGRPKNIELTALRRQALARLARREHSRRELEHNLARAGAATDLIRQVLDDLAERGLQSDVRFAEGLVNSRAGRGQGAVRIRRELVECGVAVEVIDAAFVAAGIDWQRRATEVCREKFGPTAAVDWPERARRARFLSYRGFDADVIRVALKAVTEGGQNP